MDDDRESRNLADLLCYELMKHRVLYFQEVKLFQSNVSCEASNSIVSMIFVSAENTTT